MADREFDVGEAFDAIIGVDDAPVAESPAPEPDASADIAETFDAIEEETRARDEKGRFAPKAATESTDDSAPGDGPATDAEPAPEPEVPIIERPKHLSTKLAEHWDGLTPDVQQAITDREREVHEVITRVDRERQVGRGFDRTVQDYRDIIDRDGGGNPDVAVRDLLQTARMLRSSDPATKAQLLNQICTMYDIDIEQAYYNRPAPETARAELQTQQLQSQLAAYKQLEEQSQNSQIEQTIAEFAVDKPHFYDVAPQMERLALAGISTDLSTLYKMAIAADENLSSASNAQAVELDRAAAEEASRAAQVAKARRAAISPSSAPGTAKPPGSSANLSHEEQVRLDYDRIMADMG